MAGARRGDAADILHPVVRTIVRSVLALTIIIPVGYMLLMSVTPNVEVAAGTVWPTHFAFSHYVKMWAGTNLGSGMLNSVIICGSSSAAAILLGAIAGYVSSRVRFRGRTGFLSLLLAFQSIPTVMVLLPLVIVMAGLQGLMHIAVIGTYWAVAVAYLTFALPLVTWFIAAYVDSVPRELDDAARLDGASTFQGFIKVIMPLIVPALAVAGLLSFLVGWGDLLIATVISGPGTHTVAVALDSFLATQEGQVLPQFGTLMAASVVSAAPVVILYLGLQRFVVAGLTGASVK
jgi:multiple sugar transport system permease protein